MNDKTILIMQQRLYAKAIQPFIELKVRIYQSTLQTIVLYDNNEIEFQANFSTDQQKTLDLIDKYIENLRSSILKQQP